jgi:hypothetical protein
MVATPIWEGTPLWPVSIAEQAGQEAALQALVREQNMAMPWTSRAGFSFWPVMTRVLSLVQTLPSTLALVRPKDATTG